MRVWLDFETYSEASIRDVGPSKYVEHPSTFPICLAYAIDDGPVRVWVRPCDLRLESSYDAIGLLSPYDVVYDQEVPSDLFAAIGQGAEMWAHNAEFDYAVWDQFVDCPLPVSAWRDSMAMCSYFALPLSLEGATSARKQEHLKDPRGKYLINKLCKPRRLTKKNSEKEWPVSEALQDYADLFLYCAADVEAMRELVMNLPETSLPEFEQQTWVRTVKSNLLGLPVDLEEVDLMCERLDEYEKTATARMIELTDGAIVKAGSTKKIIAWCSEHGVDLPNVQQKTIDDLLAAGGLPEKVREFFEIRRQLGRVSTKKFFAIRQRTCGDSTVKNNLVYWGAGPGRFAGRGFQPQNLPVLETAEGDDAVDHALRALDDGIDTVELLYDDFMTYASGLVRPMIRAPEGFELVCGDYSSIENRLTLWCAGEERGLEEFRQGRDQYKTFAAQRYGVAYEDVTYKQRFDSKAIVLGCGFGMGVDKFMDTCERKGNPISREEAAAAVKSYRTIYPGVPNFWYSSANAARDAVLKPGRTFEYANDFMSLKFRCEGGWLKMQLPSGRCIRYYRPRVVMRPAPWDPGEKLPTITHMGFSLAKKWTRVQLIPGRVAENAVQGIARDVMVYGLERTEAAGYTLLTTVHDENLSMIEKGRGDVEQFCELMVPDLPWLRTCPLKAEGFIGRRYKK